MKAPFGKIDMLCIIRWDVLTQTDASKEGYFNTPAGDLHCLYPLPLFLRRNTKWQNSLCIKIAHTFVWDFSQLTLAAGQEAAWQVHQWNSYKNSLQNLLFEVLCHLVWMQDSNLAGGKCQYIHNMRTSWAKWDFPWKILSIHPCQPTYPIPSG